LHTIEGKGKRGRGWFILILLDGWMDVTHACFGKHGCLLLAGFVFLGERGRGEEVPPG
jgi:hypothetical protein